MRAAEFPYLAGPPIAMAHRGGAAYPPNVGLENTLAAFRAAVALGFRHVETDVHATADGRVVAFHDPRLDRVSDATGAIAELPYAAVREARIGGREPVPLLSELLEALPETKVNIDIKSDHALEPTIREIRRLGALDRVCVASFSERRVRAARRALGPRLATACGALGTVSTRFAPALVTRYLHTPAPVLQLPEQYRIGGRQLTLVTPALVRAVHGLGKQLHVWFHSWSREDAEEMHRLLDLGADGIVTDHIHVLAEVLAQRGTPLTPT